MENYEIIQIVLGSLNLIILLVTAVAIWKTLKTYNELLSVSNETLTTNHKWNKLKTTHEILNKFIIGDIPDLSSSLKIKYNCHIGIDDNTYKKFVTELNEIEKLEFDDIIIRLLNIFEVVAIDIKNEIIDEEIAFDYLGWYYVKYYSFCEELIDERQGRDHSKNKIFENYSSLATKWTSLIDEL